MMPCLWSELLTDWACLWKWTNEKEFNHVCYTWDYFIS